MPRAKLRKRKSVPCTSLRDELREFVRERDWAQFHDPKNLVMALVSEAGELAAGPRWVRSDAADAACKEPELRARVADEVADVGICLVLLAERLGLDLGAEMKRKIAKNREKYPADVSRGRALPPREP